LTTPRKIVVTGGTGFLGRALLTELARADLTRTGPATVVCLSRNPHAAATLLAPTARALQERGGSLHTAAWDPERASAAELAPHLAGASEVHHLAGEPVVGRRLNQDRKARIMASRVQSTMRLVEAMKALSERPRVFVTASGVGFYGDRAPSEPLDETSDAGSDFLALVCVAWEAAARSAEPLGVRSVQARLGIVLGPGGGALAVMRTPIRLFVGGKLGSGEQMISWIQIQDAARALVHVAGAASVSGPVNLVAPEAISNVELTRALGRALGRPTPFWVPAAALRLVLGEGAEVLLTGQRAVPMRLLQTGFSFQYPKLAEALFASL
jgi:uncharacterized protein (TIGR01777 family)